mmetsp:Transcript_29039/g.60310  ORF Transcript_29039/g.60310 Transcript_29039/m.60310 type:complete len:280 (-) Transcript_29039:13-852(-)
MIPHPLEHFEMGDFQGGRLLRGIQQGGHLGVHGMRVNDAHRRGDVSVHHVPQRGARRLPEVGRLGRRHDVPVHVQFEDVVPHHVLLLHPRRGHEDPIGPVLLRPPHPDGHPAPGAGGPAVPIEAFAQLGHQGADRLGLFEQAPRQDALARRGLGVHGVQLGGRLADATPRGLEIDPAAVVRVEGQTARAGVGVEGVLVREGGDGAVGPAGPGSGRLGAIPGARAVRRVKQVGLLVAGGVEEAVVLVGGVGVGGEGRERFLAGGHGAAGGVGGGGALREI